MAPSTVLVTGAGRFVGGQLAARLAADSTIDRVLAVDTVPPPQELTGGMGRAEFVRVDLRDPLIAKVVSTAKVDTVVHTSMTASPRGAGGYSTMKEMNVIGTMQLLAACQRSTTVTRLVVKSTGAVYGASALDQAVFTECDEPHVISASGYAKDAVEIEGYIRGFARRREDVDVTVLRFANIIGPRIDTVLSRYFSLPVVPTVLGYDPRVQLLHEQDALAVLERAARERRPGVFNVGGAGVLMLSQAIRRMGRISVPIPAPAVATAGRLLRGAQLVDYSPEQARFLNFGRVLDTTRLRTEFGFVPRWTTAQAFDDYVRGAALRPTIDPRWIATAQRCLLGLAARFR
ncbi:MAG: NAD-dependent epimerase/dehydratase family protein [Pseudonocardiales bacterium]|nr:NAD-dependent epimerase/dehydratase family protein [Pseudonocardiales bacterium]MBV9031933.1 NAD-dependent epimerase/dehydratase family protein [Pseudonocardiales bacterium]